MIPRLANLSRAMLLLAATIAACSAADLYPVAGVVLKTETNSPLPRARVRFYRSMAAKPVAGAITGDDGRFQFQLPAGSYYLVAGTRDVLEQYGSRRPGSSLGSAVIVGSGKNTANLVFHYSPPAAIAGRVLDDSGEPVPNAIVELMRSVVLEGLRSTSVYAFERTNDIGEYRFGTLPGDASYFLSATGEPWYAESDTNGGPVFQTAAAYVPIYYPSTPDPSKAAPILLKPGQEARVDFTLTTVAGANVTVRHDAPPGTSGTLTLSSDGLAGIPVVQQARQLLVTPRPRSQPPQVSEGQTQTLKGVPPGHYTVTLTGSVRGSFVEASAPVDINGVDIAADLATKPMPKIGGTIQFPSGVAPRSPGVVSLRRADGSASVSTTVLNDGSFSFPQVMPGRYQFRLGGGDGFFATRIEARGGSMKDGLIEVSEGNDVTLSITAGDDTGVLRGFVADGDRVRESVLVVLVPDTGQKRGSSIDAQPRIYQTESDGSFDFRSVPTGRYFLFAVDDFEFEYARPEVLAPWLSRARQVDIQARTATEERIPLTSPPVP
jgi:hypothetical protein